MGDENDRLPGIVQLVEELHDLRAGPRVQVSRRLVGEQNARPIHQGPGDGHPLSLTPRELARPMSHSVGQLDPHQRLLGQAAPLSLAHPRVDQRKLHVAESRGPGQQIVALEHEADLPVADSRQLGLAEARDQAAVEPVLAPGGGVQASDQVHQGRLAGAGGAGDGHELIALDGDVDAAKRVHDLALHGEIALDAAQGDQRVGRSVRRSSTSHLGISELRGEERSLDLRVSRELTTRAPRARPTLL